MGKENDAMLSYLEDNERFADLFNLVYFGGRQVVRAQELLEASEVYPARPKEDERPRIRDLPVPWDGRMGRTKKPERHDGFRRSHSGRAARTASVLMGVKKFMEQEEKYKKGERYNMCQALREMMEDSKEEGRKEGKSLVYTLMNTLIEQNRLEDFVRSKDDAAYREQLYREFQL